MPRALVSRTEADVQVIERLGRHGDSRRAAWTAIRQGSLVIRDVQRISPRHRNWRSLDDAEPYLNDHAKRILAMRREAIEALKLVPHHERGFRMSRNTGAKTPRPVNCLCLISGHEGQEIPGLIAYDRVVVDVEYMDQALGPATADVIFGIRKRVGENVYISTNVSEMPQIVRDSKGEVDSRSSAALTSLRVVAALYAGADVVKVGFANLDGYKRDLKSKEVIQQMKLIRGYVDKAVASRALFTPLNRTGRYPLISVFFPEIGIDSNGERPKDIAAKAIELTRQGGWQGVLIDTFEKCTGKKYRDFYTLEASAELAEAAHRGGLEFWVAGSITREEIAGLVKSNADLICFGGAARHAGGERRRKAGSITDESIKRPLVERLVEEFEKTDPRPQGECWPYAV